MEAQNDDDFGLYRLNPDYTFNGFIIGSSNRMAHAASLAVAEMPGKAYNPLYFWGDSGLNKTHLLHAIGNRAVQKNPELKAFYVQSCSLATTLRHAAEKGTYPALLAHYVTVDLLLIDDIQDIEGQQTAQEQFFRLFSTLRNAVKQLVIASDRPPLVMMSAANGLRAFCESGLIAGIYPPDYEMRVAIVRAKAESQQRQIADEVIEYIARNSYGTVRDIEHALMHVMQYAGQQGCPLTTEVAAEALSSV